MSDYIVLAEVDTSSVRLVARVAAVDEADAIGQVAGDEDDTDVFYATAVSALVKGTVTRTISVSVEATSGAYPDQTVYIEPAGLP